MSTRNSIAPMTVTIIMSVLVCGCATGKKQPTEELTRARTIVQQAEKGNAQRYAAADLQRAHDELSSAENAANNRRYDEARRFAERAEVDGNLAAARGNSGEAQQAAQEIRRSIDTLRRESSRNAGSTGTTGPNDSGTADKPVISNPEAPGNPDPGSR